MDDSRRYYRLGVFVVVTVALLAAILFILGGRSLFQPTFTFETYFNESVAGLDLGAPVKYRGVPLGTVTEIVTSGAAYEGGVPLRQRKSYIVVRVKVAGSREQTQELARDAVEYVKLGMRVQTQLAGITGQQYLALDFLDPGKHPPLAFTWTPKYPYVPSAPSLTGEIVANAQAFLANLNKADIGALGQHLNALVVNVSKKVDELRVADLSADADGVLKDARTTIDHVDRILAGAPIDETVRNLESASARLDTLLADPGLARTVDNAAAMTGRLRTITDRGDLDRLVTNLAAVSDRLRKIADSGDLDRLVTRLDEVAERLDAVLGDNQYDVRGLIQDLRATAGNLRTLSESIKRYPAGLLTGGPPERVELPREAK